MTASALGFGAALWTAAPTLAASVPAGCATIHHQDAGSGGDHAAFSHVTVTFPGDSGTLSATGQTLTGTTGSAGDVADASSVLLLAALTGHHNAACSQWLETQGQVAQASLAAGHALHLVWTSIAVKRATLHVSIANAALTINGSGSDAKASLTFSGVTTSGTAATSLLPSSAQASFSMPTNEMASLMAATAGKSTQLPAVHVTIQSLSAKRDTVELSGNGRATLTGEHGSASASGHLEIRDIGTLIQKAQQDSQTKIAAALVLARIVSHKNGDSNTWDTNWEGGILTVNGVPLPLR
ncbi:hypothetical protein [Acetobacter sp.]|jgi:hypothetical protein|uniref:hypothetical protein n=1 Tax=Acetobacter sp. TaxID=440 RepID=UPI0025C3AB88|nr:hypothetical protein [Acetobacter sp.]MCH4090566.1 hypothetical protein [Acetobacter sp.]MCI1299260.1 hypothetical protein [Acetobacter sp.]MCI1315807.1 hypothetical protein [Acetobacter sp.]